jgi:hypothetical protein
MIDRLNVTFGFKVPVLYKVRMPGFRIAGSSVIVVGEDCGVAEMLPWLGLMTKPDGITVTVPVPGL